MCVSFKDICAGQCHFSMSKSHSKEIDTRQFGLPDNTRCFLMLNDELYLASPELCFAQVARRATEIELMKLGFELCGSYLLDPSRNVGFKNRPALTTKDAILKPLASLPNNCPASARKAIHFVRDGSDSPMEDCLALFLGLPVRFGGYGLGIPRMNAEIAIGTHSSLRTNHGLYHCDLYWGGIAGCPRVQQPRIPYERKGGRTRCFAREQSARIGNKERLRYPKTRCRSE